MSAAPTPAMRAVLRQLIQGKQPDDGRADSLARLGYANLRRALIRRGLAEVHSGALVITDAGRMVICEKSATANAVELLRALERLHDVCTNMALGSVTEDEYAAAMDAAEAAIAKATGAAS